MKSALFDVTVFRDGDKSETTLVADNLTGYAGRNGEPCIAFICSGRLETIPVRCVRKIEINGKYQHCGHCDSNVSGVSFGNSDPIKEQA